MRTVSVLPGTQLPFLLPLSGPCIGGWQEGSANSCPSSCFSTLPLCHNCSWAVLNLVFACSYPWLHGLNSSEWSQAGSCISLSDRLYCTSLEVAERNVMGSSLNCLRTPLLLVSALLDKHKEEHTLSALLWREIICSSLCAFGGLSQLAVSDLSFTIVVFWQWFLMVNKS